MQTTENEQQLIDGLLAEAEASDELKRKYVRIHDFEKSQLILQHLVHHPKCWDVGQNLLPELFEEQGHAAIFKVVKSLWQKHGEFEKDVVQAILKDNVTGDNQYLYLGELEAIYGNPPLVASSTEEVRRMICEFHKEQELRTGILKAMDACVWNNKGVKGAIEALNILKGTVASAEAIGTSNQTKPPYRPADIWGYSSKVKTLIPKFLLSGMLTMFSAREKHGKTHWMIGFLADCLALGEVMKTHIEPVPTLYCDYEMGIDLFSEFYFKRLFPSPDSPNFQSTQDHFHYYEAGQLPDFITPASLTKLVEGHKQPGFVVIDTIRGGFGRTPSLAKVENWENNPGAVGAILRPVQKWCHETGWNVFVVHHNNKSGQFNGSAEFGAAVDAIWEFNPPINKTKEDPEREINASGRGIGGTFSFKFVNGRYQFYEAKDWSDDELKQWVQDQHQGGKILLQAKLIENGKKESIPDNRIRDAHKKLVNSSVLVQVSKAEGYKLAS
jgi:hypothetical protein